MKAQDKTKEELVAELLELRGRNSELEALALQWKETEDRLQKSEERLELALKGADLGLWDYNLQTGEAFINQRRAEMVGYSVDELEPHFSSWGRMVHPDDTHKVRKAFNAHVKGETPLYECEHRLRCKSGEYIWVLARAKVVEHDAAGNPVRITGTSLDITERKRAEAVLRRAGEELDQMVQERTAELGKANEELRKEIAERKQAEEALRESEEKYRLLVETSQNGIFIAQDALIKFANPRVSEVTGYSNEELLGGPGTRFIHPEDMEWVLQNHLKRLRGETVQSRYAFRIVTKGGEVRWVEFEGVLINWKGRPAVLCFTTDITHRKQAEEALKESEAKYRFLTESMQDIVWTVDLGMNTTYVSSSIEKVLGFTPEERMNQAASEQLTPESFELAGKLFAKELQYDTEPDADPDRTMRLELDYLRKDGSVVCLETILSFIRDEKSNPTGIYGLSRDVTERKKAEQTLLESEERYRKLVDLAPDGIAVHSEGKVIFANKAAAALLGGTPADFIGRTALDFVDPDSRDLVKKRIERMSETGVAAPLVEDKVGPG